MDRLTRNLLLFLFFLNSYFAVGQIVGQGNSLNSSGKRIREDDIDTTFSIKNIREDDKMYQISVWRRINLKEKFNLGLYGTNENAKNGLIHNIFVGIKDGSIPIFSDPDFNNEIDVKHFDSLVFKNGTVYDTLTIQDYYYLDFKEDFVFDQRHSRFVFDVKFFQLVRPAEHNKSTKEDPPILYFSYKDFIRHFEKEKYIRPSAVWINFKNPSKSLTYPQAFESRKFRSYITKFTNESDETVIQLVNNKITDSEKRKLQAYIDAMNFEYKLLDFENSVWEW
jgi:gliding motility associated protien GldN